MTRSRSPEYIIEYENGASDISNRPKYKGRPISLSADMLAKVSLSPEGDKNLKYLQADQLQKELVQAKMDEVRERKEVKKRKSDIGSKSRESASKRHDSPVKSGFSTWHANDANNMREKSKQFFNVGVVRDSARSTTSSRSVQLQRQSSLPPRNKKENIDTQQRMLPRTPSDPKSPETLNDRKYIHGTSSAPNSKPSTPIKQTNKSPFDSLHRKPKHKDSRTEDVQRNRANHNHDHSTDGKKYPSISDLTRSGGSVKISHKAQI